MSDSMSVDELDRILKHYGEYKSGVYQGISDYDEGVAIEWEEMEVIGYIYENPELLEAEL